MIIAEMINSEGIEIFDENNIPVNLISPSQFTLQKRFTQPFFRIDNFEKELGKNMEIKRIDLIELERIGFRIVAIRTESRTRWYPRQSKMYLLEDTNKPIPKSEILTSVPKEHSIEMDVTHKRIRLKGKNAGYPHVFADNASRWVQL